MGGNYWELSPVVVAILNFRKKNKIKNLYMHTENKKDAAHRFWTAQRRQSTTEHMTPHYNYRTVGLCLCRSLNQFETLNQFQTI